MISISVAENKRFIEAETIGVVRFMWRQATDKRAMKTTGLATGNELEPAAHGSLQTLPCLRGGLQSGYVY
jgi:hypothetical protein